MTAVRSALTVDVEEHFQVSAFDHVIPRERWGRIRSRVENNTRRLLDLFDERDTKATFFVLGWVAERHPRLVREIATRGHEIASHGQTHELVYRQDPKTFREETMRSKDVLEDQAQQPVEGYRAASYSITPASLWALDILVELGFTWDSSIFPIHHDRYGIPTAPRWPHTLRTPSGYTLTELPLTTWQVGGQRLPVAGGGYFRLYPYALTRYGLRAVNGEGRPFIFYLHPWEVDPDQPRIRAGWRSRLRHYVGLRRCEGRLGQLLQDFELTTVESVLTDLESRRMEDDAGAMAFA
ncbi:MAG: XrtA system polysaccharide deacetylase [Halofilum sp. (in: g-proteobacteria)]